MSFTFWDLAKAEDGAPIVPKKSKKALKFNSLDSAKLDLIRLQCKLEDEEDRTLLDSDNIAKLNRVIAGKKEQMIGLLG